MRAPAVADRGGDVDDPGALLAERRPRPSRRPRRPQRRDGHARQHLARRDGGQVDALEELVGVDRALGLERADRHRRAGRRHQRRQVIGRVVDAEVAADGAAVPHLDVGDRERDLGQDRARGAHRVGADQLVVGDHRADARARRRAGLDRAQLVDPVQVDDQLRRRDPCLHHVDEALPAGERAGVLARREQPHGLVHGLRPRVFDLPQQHGASLTGLWHVRSAELSDLQSEQVPGQFFTRSARRSRSLLALLSTLCLFVGRLNGRSRPRAGRQRRSDLPGGAA